MRDDVIRHFHANNPVRPIIVEADSPRLPTKMVHVVQHHYGNGSMEINSIWTDEVKAHEVAGRLNNGRVGAYVDFWVESYPLDQENN